MKGHLRPCELPHRWLSRNWVTFRSWCELQTLQLSLVLLIHPCSWGQSLKPFWFLRLSITYLSSPLSLLLIRKTKNERKKSWKSFCIFTFSQASFLPWLEQKITQLFYSAAAAKSLQSCLTLFDPKDGSPPGSPIPGILQARTLEWVVISFYSNHLLFHPKYELPDSSIIYFPTSPKSPAFSNKTWFTRNFNCEMAREGITRW